MRATLFTLACLWAFVGTASAKTPILIDTDIGSDVDDAFALALAIASPELELVGLTTVGGPTEDRAWLACRFLSRVGIKSVPVAFGAAPQPKGKLDGQVQYRRHPAAVFNRTLRPSKESAVELMARLAADRDGLVIVALGPLTNVARLIRERPDAARRVKRFVVMGGSLAVGYEGKPKPEPEWNIRSDIPAARSVFASGLPLTVVPLDATATVRLDRSQRDRLFAARSVLTYQVQNLYELWDKETPILFDPVAVAAALGDRFLTFQDQNLSVDDAGMTVPTAGKPNARVATGIQGDEFVRWYVERVRAVGAEAKPRPNGKSVSLVESGGFPLRVHVVEDFETDIERRWWLSGKLETKDVPRPGTRACRAVLTQDFDDRQGDLAATYRAVVFNPVPGPPVGPNTRLRFRYKLSGTDTLRIQLYSLSKGYHRCLFVSNLVQGKWTDATADLTTMRRPDGTGGPLTADERIDDIQFYVDPAAEFLIDDIVLYEAAAAGERRPFPERVIFTGWFDTGKQGQEWPGAFEIVPHESPRTWKAARSVSNPDSGDPWLRIGLRGLRHLGPKTVVTFQYRVTGADRILVELRNSTSRKGRAFSWEPVRSGEWAAATIDLPGSPGPADELLFTLPRGARLELDNLLISEPGTAGNAKPFPPK